MHVSCGLEIVIANHKLKLLHLLRCADVRVFCVKIYNSYMQCGAEKKLKEITK